MINESSLKEKKKRIASLNRILQDNRALIFTYQEGLTMNVSKRFTNNTKVVFRDLSKGQCSPDDIITVCLPNEMDLFRNQRDNIQSKSLCNFC